MSYRFEVSGSAMVARFRSALEAERAATALVVAGVDAWASPRVSVYPSVDFVEGVGVWVGAGAAARARELLAAYGLSGEPPEEPSAADPSEAAPEAPDEASEPPEAGRDQ